ncbi:hypothetical protein GCM10009100_26840 [Thalassospira tepidiphila]
MTMSRPDHDSFKLYPVRIRLTDTVLKTVSIPINPLNSFLQNQHSHAPNAPKIQIVEYIHCSQVYLTTPDTSCQQKQFNEWPGKDRMASLARDHRPDYAATKVILKMQD